MIGKKWKERSNEKKEHDEKDNEKKKWWINKNVKKKSDNEEKEIDKECERWMKNERDDEWKNKKLMKEK